METIDAIAELVSDALKKRADPLLKTELLVLKEGIRKRSDRWYVPVYPAEAEEGERPYAYYNALAMAMEELDDSGVKIQLIPASAPETVSQ